MVRKFLMLAFSGLTFFFSAYAQTDSALTVSGSVDGYYRYNFANAKDLMETNSYTSFTSSHNSFELGMASVKFAYSKGKVGAVADLGFGTRASEFSYNEIGMDALSSIKQGYVWYAPSDKVKFSMGKWATHLGYELVDPQLNRNYSMSYMFSYGPFSHTALKVDFTLNGGFGIMLGVSNPTDYLSASFAKKNIIAQVSKTSDNFNAYLNYVGGEDLGDNMINQFGLTATAKISDKFGIGYDGTVKSVNPTVGSTESWFGSALYLNFDPSEKVGITARGEYFSDKKGVAGFGTSLFDATLSLNLKPTSNIMIIPEFRVDAAKDPIFFKNSDSPILPSAKSSGTFILAAIVSF